MHVLPTVVTTHMFEYISNWYGTHTAFGTVVAVTSPHLDHLIIVC